MSANGNDETTLFTGTPHVRDWTWWSDFLQREYYGTAVELNGWRGVARSIARDVGLRPGERAIDLGSGCGELAMQLTMLGADVTGVERSAPLVDWCRREAERRELSTSFVAGSMFEYEPSEPVDLVLCVNTSLGYGEDPENRGLFRRIAGWLAPGGRLYLDTFTSDAAEAFGTWSDDLAGGRFIVDNEYDEESGTMTSWPTWVSPDGELFVADSPEVVRLYPRALLEELMREAGLEPMRLERGMGRRFRQTDDQMANTWIATRVNRTP